MTTPSRSGNPWEVPGWRSIGRECALIRQLIGAGATSLGRANYADKTGEYYTAFFGLSIGIERLAKLIFVVDHAIQNSGAMPSDNSLRAYGHRLASLIKKSHEIGSRLNVTMRYPYATNPIIEKIVESLDAFADASRGRYANFAALGDPDLSGNEPIRKWWSEVGNLILDQHYYGTKRQKKVEQNARIIDSIMSPVSMVIMSNEAGDIMQTVEEASLRSGQNAIIQKYGRYHTLVLVRNLSEIFSRAAEIASEKFRYDAFYGAWEYFWSYVVEDTFLLNRKVWPL